MINTKFRTFASALTLTFGSGMCSLGANAASLNLADTPLFVSQTVAPLTMLVMGRDHKLYYEAYNDATDLNGDGIVDTGYQGYYRASESDRDLVVDYYGYFNSYVCYDYDSSSNRFEPVSAKSATEIAAKDKRCDGTAGDWSGDFLNYITTARIDAVRKVFYGGLREVDTTSDTVLERTHIPQDAHAWGKEYESIASDGYDIAEYTPLTEPDAGFYHLFANISLNSASSPYGSMQSTAEPLMRVMENSSHRVWEWLSKERPVAGADCIDGINGPTVSCETAGGASWELIPDAQLSSLTRTFYDTTGYGTYPNNYTDYEALETAYAISANEFGTGSSDSPSNLTHSSGNPYGSDDDYLTIITGRITVPSDGAYSFSVDGDDAVEFIIDEDGNGVFESDEVVGAWYGGHGTCSTDTCLNSRNGPATSMTLSASTSYAFKYRHQERGGGDSYYAYWSDIVPTSSIVDYDVKVQVCTSVDRAVSHNTNSCQVYPNGEYKPTGLLHEFGEDDTMMFGLISGSYHNNLDGGVLRKAVSSFTDEVDSTTGVFTSVSGIVDTMDKLRVVNFNDSSYAYSCGWITGGPISNGQCDMWGNPVAEMMYESLRYFAGKATPTSDFTYSGTTNDSNLGLPLATWSDPYDATTGFDECAKPFQIVISDINPSYDSDKVPGSYFGTFTGDVTGLNVADETNTVGTNESIYGSDFFIGQSGATSDNAPTPKTVTNLGQIRGIAPEEPTKLGSYYSAGLAYYGFTNDISAATGEQNLQTFSVALASPLPTIQVDVDGDPSTDDTVTIVPFAKSVGNGSAWTSFQPTNQIVDFYVESLGATTGSFLINYEDVEQGADHDMDAISRYTYTVNGDGTVTIDVDSIYAAGGIDQHMGYVISGTTQDGVYLEVKDRGGRDVVYDLDTPAGVWAGDARGTDLLGFSASRTFTPSTTSSSAGFLENPLWYAAKWGGFIEDNELTANDLPDETAEWDGDNDGDPDNYFLVTNALNLQDQMEAAFNEVLARSGSASTVTVSSGSLNTDTLLFQALFDTDNWQGTVRARELFSSEEVADILESDPDSTVQQGDIGATNWEFSEQLRDQLASTGGHAANREVITINTSTGNGVAFDFPVDHTSPDSGSEISSDQVTSLLAGISSDQQAYGEDLVEYLRGDDANEVGVGGAVRTFRSRGEGDDRNVVGDIVNSDPLYMPRPGFFYPDAWPTTIDGSSATAPENSATQKYSDYRELMIDRDPVLFVGTNAGMFHAINAYANESGVTDGGNEILAYVPGELYDNLPELADRNYDHKYYVDGKSTYNDAFFTSDSKWHTVVVGTLNAGGQGLFALDASDPKGIASGYPSFDETNADEIVLWEFTDEDDADLGFTFGRPTIARMANGEWAAIFGNGYDNTEADGTVSSTGNAVIYIVNIETGALIKKFDTGQGMAEDPTSSSKPNGMSEPLAADINGDFVVDYIYAGDLFGNMWKIDVSSTNDSSWDFAFDDAGDPAPLFVAESSGGTRIPITSRPQLGAHPEYGFDGDNLVFFGTGKYLEASDNTRVGQTTQSFFGIWDDGSNDFDRSDLLVQTIEEDLFDGRSVRTVSDNEIRWDDVVDGGGTVTAAKHGGWVVDLLNSGASTLANQGERAVSNPTLRDGRIFFTTLIPSNDACDFGGSGWLMVIDAVNGGAIETGFIDVNGDGLIDEEDLVDTDGDGKGDTSAVGLKNDSGIPTALAHVDGDGATIGYSSSSDDSSGDSVDKSVYADDPDIRRRLNWRELNF